MSTQHSRGWIHNDICVYVNRALKGLRKIKAPPMKTRAIFQNNSPAEPFSKQGKKWLFLHWAII